MGRPAVSQRKIAALLADGVPRGTFEIGCEVGLSSKAVQLACVRAWESGLLLRSEKQFRGRLAQFRGRGGTVSNDRGFYMYTLRPEGVDSLVIDSIKYVPFDEKYLSGNAPKGESKADRIIRFIEENKEKAVYSNEIFDSLKELGIKKPDIMSVIRRHEKKGTLFVRGYRTEINQTPFTNDFLITWIDSSLPRERTIREAFQRTENALLEDSTSNVTGQRARAIRDQVLSDAQMKEITSIDILDGKLKINKTQLDYAVGRALQLYPDIKSIEIFGYKYLYYSSLAREDLRAAIMLKEDWIRKAKGRDNRLGHNWEACVEWFIDKLTPGAQFMTQSHRAKGIDDKRIILHLTRPVGGRRNNAEIDRVWKVKPSLFSPEVTYALQSKWGIIMKRYLDDHLEVLRWSQEFGLDTEGGRDIQQGIIAIFAGTAFNPNDIIHIGENRITLAQYCQRMKIDLIKAADLNDTLQKRGVENFITVQKVCRLSMNEVEVRETLTKMWNQPEKARQFIVELAQKNQGIYEIERMLEESKRSSDPVTLIPD